MEVNGCHSSVNWLVVIFWARIGFDSDYLNLILPPPQHLACLSFSLSGMYIYTCKTKIEKSQVYQINIKQNKKKTREILLT